MALALAGCTAGELPRAPRRQDDLLAARQADEAQANALRREVSLRRVARFKARQDAYMAGRERTPPVINLLILSGGGDWGAFGAGVLKGWGRASGPTGRPEFDVVTGVSTGALIAPFALLGDAESIDRIVALYRNPPRSWFRPRGLISFLAGGASYGDIGRVLAVSTSNLDFGEVRTWASAWAPILRAGAQPLRRSGRGCLSSIPARPFQAAISGSRRITPSGISHFPSPILQTRTATSARRVHDVPTV